MKSGKQPSVPGAGRLGMAIFLVSLSVLFVAGIVGYLVVRLRVSQWVPPGTAGLPAGLWVATAILVASSVTMHGALSSIRRGEGPGLRRDLLATAALGTAFLVVQGVNWWRMVAVDGILATRSLYAFTFYALTGLHALHVVGGLVCLGVTWWRASRGAYSWAEFEGVRLAATYWHFVDVVWVVLFVVLRVGT